MNFRSLNDIPVISSRQNPSIVDAVKLTEKKHRQSEGLFRFDGIKLFEEAIKNNVEITTVFIMQSRAEKLIDSIGSFLTSAIDIKVLSDGVFEKISEEKAPQGIICIAKHIDKLHKIATINNIDTFLSEDEKVFALESVRDPGNLGTIIRSARAFGVDTLLISSDCAELYNPKTIRAAMGTLFSQKIIIADDLPAIVRRLSDKGRKAYAATLADNARLLGRFELSGTDLIIVGNEGHGLSSEIINACSERVLIPMTENAESLNAAIASSVCLWEQFGRNL